MIEMPWIIIWLIGYILGCVAMTGFFTSMLHSRGLGWWFFYHKPLKNR